TLWAKTYNEIRFTGLLRLSELSATELIGFSAGEEVSADRINAAIHKLFAQEYFTDIVVDEPEAGVLRFIFTEKPVIAHIGFKGMSDSERDEKYLPVFGIKRGEIYDPRRIEAAKKRLLALSSSEGYYDSIVEVEATIKDNKADLEVTYATGSKITINKIDINGAKHIDPAQLQKVIANRERQSFSWFPGRGNGELKLLELPYDGERMRDYYLQQGYLDAEVSEPFLIADLDSYFATLKYTVTEGERYTISAIAIDVVDQGKDLSYLIDDLRLQNGDRFNVAKMRADISSIREEAAEGGYAFARVSPDIRKNEAGRTVDIIYRVEYGKKVYIRDVIISGNTRTIDRVVRREIFLAPGDLYSMRNIRESRSALGRLGYFESVEIDERRVSESEMDLAIEVKETSTGSLMVGGGYSSYDGFLINASLADRNIFGSGIGYTFAIDTSKRTRRLELSLDNPRINDSNYAGSTGFYQTHYEATTYTRDSEGADVTISRRLGRYWNAGLTPSYSSNDNEYEDPNDFYVNGKTTKLSLTPYISFNNTDDYFVPRRGVMLSQSLEFAGFGENEQYTRSQSSFAFYYGFADLIDYDLIFRFRARMQFVDADINDVEKYPIGSRLFIGGPRSVRGYQSGSIAPYHYENGAIAKDSDGNVRYIGGKRAFTTALELSVPLVEEAKIRASAFYDFGAIGVDDFDMRRSSYGVSVEWISPMGPLQLIFAQPIDRKSEDDVSTFEFSIGQRF
ncbi:MAG: outer membrane protein assembly factor BamA, partial [Helicobacteraceae bacterium]|nr:outer membrane protein assembly factor BamA [Helicobacteraceae bacterium]